MKLQNIIDKFPKFNVAVVGDLMLDKYIFGQATRISQEAPVPVVRVTEERTVPGGAANVARNVVSLGAHAEVFGAVAEDYDGDILLKHLQDDGIATDTIGTFHDRHTIVKTRVLAANQQVVRVDHEITDEYARDIQTEILQKLETRLKEGKLNAVILEDYAKGLFTPDFMGSIVELTHKYHVMSALDPHSEHPYDIKGISIMTPNRAEAFALAKMKFEPMPSKCSEDSKLPDIGKRLLSQWGLEYLLITLGANGMALFPKNKPGEFSVIPTVAKQVFDVSGAGDTVMASVVLALLSGATPEIACRISNIAAGVVVGRIGTSAIEADVLKKEVASFS